MNGRAPVAPICGTQQEMGQFKRAQERDVGRVWGWLRGPFGKPLTPGRCSRNMEQEMVPPPANITILTECIMKNCNSFFELPGLRRSHKENERDKVFKCSEFSPRLGWFPTTKLGCVLSGPIQSDNPFASCLELHVIVSASSFAAQLLVFRSSVAYAFVVSR